MTSERYRDYLAPGLGSEPVPERIPDPYHRPDVHVMRTAEGNWEASEQGEFAELASFTGGYEDAVGWGLARSPTVYVEGRRLSDPGTPTTS